MNKTVILLTLAATILVLSVYSVTCTDSDEGPIDPTAPKEFLAKPGNTTIAKTTLVDHCMREKNGVKVTEGPWIKEYMCIGNLAIGKDYKCSDYGYDKCITDKGLSACVAAGKTTVTAPKPVATPSNTTAPKKPKTPLKPQCGDKKIQPDLGEQCDPPGRLCVDADGYAGTCEKNCKCAAYKKGEVPPPEQIKPVEAKPVEQTVPATPAETKTETKEITKETIQQKKDQKVEEKLPENAGLFARLWNWLNTTFS